jgi:tetratricopeptide (TPR) repeat protein
MGELAFRSARAALLLTAAVFAAGCGGAQSRHDRFMERGQEYFVAQNFDKARLEFNNALQIQPKDAEARYMSGRVAEKLEKVRDAVGAYQGAIDVNPEHLGARTSLGRIMVFAGAPERAMEIIEPALAKHPDDAELLVVRGAARIQLKDIPGALADAEQAVKLAPDSENAIALLASLYRQSNESAKAVDLLKQAIVRVPTSSDLRLVLATLYASQGDAAAATSEMEGIVKIKPNVAGFRQQLALMLARQKRWDEAEAVLARSITDLPAARDLKIAYVDLQTAIKGREGGEKALREFIAQDAKDLDLQLALGTFLERFKDTAAAKQAYQRLVAQEGDRPQGIAARTRIASLELQDGNEAAARKLVDEVLQKNPRDNDALILRGNIALSHNDPTSAIADLRTVLRDQPEAVGVIRVLSRAHLANGEVALAEEQLRRAMTIAPTDVGVRLDLAQVLAQTNRVTDALPLVEAVVKDQPSHVGAREALARLYVSTGQLANASTAAQDLKTLRPESPMGWFIAGSVAASQKNYADARANLEKALELQPQGMDILTALTRVDLESGRQQDAIARLTKLAEQNPGQGVPRNMLGELRLAAKDYDAAKESFEMARKSTPGWWLPYRNLALVRLIQNDPAGAIQIYKEGVEATHYEVMLVSDLASLYEKNKQPDEAISLLERLVATKPKLAVGSNNLAMLLVTYRTDAASLDRARDLTAAFSSANDGNLLDTFGWVRFKRGEQAEGLSALERAQELLPRSAVIRYHLAMAQLKAGLTDKARRNLQVSLEGNAAFAEAEHARTVLAQLDKKAG